MEVTSIKFHEKSLCRSSAHTWKRTDITNVMEAFREYASKPKNVVKGNGLYMSFKTRHSS